MGPIVLVSSLALFFPKVTGSTDGLKSQVVEEEEGQIGTALAGEMVVGCRSLGASMPVTGNPQIFQLKLSKGVVGNQTDVGRMAVRLSPVSVAILCPAGCLLPMFHSSVHQT